MQLHPGEFVGQTVEASIPYFNTKTIETAVRQQYHLTSLAYFEDGGGQLEMTRRNFGKIREEAVRTVKRYPNVYGQPDGAN
jgi:hypothetical protein